MRTGGTLTGAKQNWGGKDARNVYVLDEKQYNMLIYTTADGLTRVDVTFEQDTVWLTRAQMAELFQRDRSVISRHIKNVFTEGELDSASNVQNLHVAGSDKPVTSKKITLPVSRRWKN